MSAPDPLLEVRDLHGHRGVVHRRGMAELSVLFAPQGRAGTVDRIRSGLVRRRAQ